MADTEGGLIYEARTGQVPRVSLAKAAKRVGISTSRWRQVEQGAHAPADTVALMARAVGVTPDGLRGAGRIDAAKALERLGEQSRWTEDDDPIIRIIQGSNYLDDDEKRQLVEMRRQQNQLAVNVIEMISGEDSVNPLRSP